MSATITMSERRPVTIDPNQCVIGRDDLAAECIGELPAEAI